MYPVGPLLPKDRVRLTAALTILPLFSLLPNGLSYSHRPFGLHKARCGNSPRPNYENRIGLFRGALWNLQEAVPSLNFSQLSFWILKMEINKSVMGG